MPETHPKITQNRQTVVNEISREIKRCLKRDRDIGRKAVLSDVKTAFVFNPALKVIKKLVIYFKVWVLKIIRFSLQVSLPV